MIIDPIPLSLAQSICICFYLIAPLLEEGGELKMAFKVMTKKGQKKEVRDPLR